MFFLSDLPPLKILWPAQTLLNLVERLDKRPQIVVQICNFEEIEEHPATNKFKKSTLYSVSRLQTLSNIIVSYALQKTTFLPLCPDRNPHYWHILLHVWPCYLFFEHSVHFRKLHLQSDEVLCIPRNKKDVNNLMFESYQYQLQKFVKYSLEWVYKFYVLHFPITVIQIRKNVLPKIWFIEVFSVDSWRHDL